MEYSDISEVGKIKHVKSPCLTEIVKNIVQVVLVVFGLIWAAAIFFTEQKGLPSRVEKLEAEVSSVKSEISVIRTKTDMIYDIVSRRK